MTQEEHSRFAELAAAFVYLQQSPHTQAAYRTDLAGFARWCTESGTEPLESDSTDIERYRQSCAEAGASASTVARRLSALSSFYQYATQAGVVNGSPVAAVQRPVASASPTADLSSTDADALVMASAVLGAKTVALVHLLLFDGVRLADLLAADVEDLVSGDDEVRLSVSRRGARSDIALDPRSAAALAVYLADRSTGPLLHGDSPTRQPARLTRFGADYLLKQAGRRAGLEPAVSANTLRRRFVAVAVATAGSARAARRRVGHADARTTRRHVT